MEFAPESIKFIMLALAIVIIGYVVFLMYKETTNSRSEISRLKSLIVEIQSKPEPVYTGVDSGNDADDESVVISDDESDYEEESYVNYDDMKQSTIFDQLLLDSDHLKNLQQLQSEIKGEPEIQEVMVEEPEIQEIIVEEEPEITFNSVSKVNKCTKILKSGKRKGEECANDTVRDTLVCKHHTPKE